MSVVFNKYIVVAVSGILFFAGLIIPLCFDSNTTVFKIINLTNGWCKGLVSGVPCVYMGLLISKINFSKFKNNYTILSLICFVVFSAISFIQKYFLLNIQFDFAAIFLLPTVLFICIAVLNSNIKINEHISLFFRKSSILIYCIHPMICYFLLNIYKNGISIIVFLTVSVLSILFSELIIVLSRKIRFLKYFY